MRIRVIIIGHGYTSRLGLIRSLGEINCEIFVIVMISHNWFGRFARFEVGKPVDCFSKYVHKVLYCKSGDEDALVNLLMNRCASRDQKAIIIPDSDSSAVVIDNNQVRLGECFLFPHIKHTVGAIEYWMRKTVQKKLASEIGLNVIKGCPVAVNDAECVIPDTIGYPCFIKPLESIRGGKSIFKRCDTEDELCKELCFIGKKINAEVLIEDFKVIDKEYAIVGVSDGQTVRIPGVIKFLSNSQSHFGIARQGEIIPTSGFENMIDKFQQFVRHIGFSGLFDIDFFESENQLFFGEINLRFGGSGYSYTASGVNLPAMFVRSIMGESLEFMKGEITKKAIFVNERTCIDDWVSGYISKRKMYEIINSAEIRFVYNSEDILPQKKLEQYIWKQGIKRYLKRWKSRLRLVN